MNSQQVIISGVGGQGILFITRLLAEAAITRGLPVLTSETHGMAQRGGIVISHLKVGNFDSPLVRPGQADCLIALKADNVPLHRHFLRQTGWIVANAAEYAAAGNSAATAVVDADRLALQLDNPQAVNLIVLGRAAATGRLFCSAPETEEAIRRMLSAKTSLLDGSIAAFRAGLESTPGAD